MVDEARAGMHWLKGLDEAEPPRNLVHNILAQTIGALPSEHVVPAPRGEGWLRQAEGPAGSDVCAGGNAALRHVVRHGVLLHHHAAGHRRLPHGRCAAPGSQLQGHHQTYYATQARVVRYYENIRLVYEIESRVRDLRRAATPAEQAERQQETPAPIRIQRIRSEERQPATAIAHPELQPRR